MANKTMSLLLFLPQPTPTPILEHMVGLNGKE